jgi:hypothetical protein
MKATQSPKQLPVPSIVIVIVIVQLVSVCFYFAVLRLS